MKNLLPNNWVKTDLKDTVYFQEGPGLRKFQYREEGIPFLNIRTIVNGHIENDLCKFLDEIEVTEKYKHFLLNEGDIICSTSGTIGKTAIVKKSNLPLMLNTSIIRFRSRKVNLVIQNYIHYYLKSNWFFDQADKYSTGTAQKNLGPSHLNLFKFPLPPLPEQKRIVAKLDGLFGHLEQAKTRLSKVPQLLKDFRQAVLTKAVSGELTEDFRKENNLPYWETIMSSELFNFITSGSRGWAKHYDQEGDQLFVRITNMNYGSFELDLDPKKLQFLRLPGNSEGKRTLLQHRDILISITADVGMISIIPEAFQYEGYVNQHVCLARPINSVNEEFLAFFLMSEKGLGQLKDKSRGATKAGLTLTDIRNIEVDLPESIEQSEIVKRIKELFTKMDIVEEKYTDIKQKIDNLPQAILAKAFKGEIVQQLPTDGDARELLKEIEALKAEVKPNKRSKK